MSYDCACDYDPPSFYTREVRCARKPHRCEECAGEIQRGDKYEYVSGMWDGYFGDFKTCEHCVDLRTWTRNNIPCLCWAHGNLIEDCKTAVEEAVFRAPDETVGLRFGFLRRQVVRDKFYAARRLTPSLSPRREA